jgi:hypothetical protein
VTGAKRPHRGQPRRGPAALLAARPGALLAPRLARRRARHRPRAGEPRLAPPTAPQKLATPHPRGAAFCAAKNGTERHSPHSPHSRKQRTRPRRQKSKRSNLPDVRLRNHNFLKVGRVGILWLSFRPLSPPHPSGAGWGEWGDGGAGWEQQRNRDGTNRKASTPTILLSNDNVLLTMTDPTRICHISHWPELTSRDHSVSRSDARAWTGYCPL